MCVAERRPGGEIGREASEEDAVGGRVLSLKRLVLDLQGLIEMLLERDEVDAL
jgi:hypothetical protein